MTNIKIVADSSVQMTPEEVAQYQVTIIPLTVMIDGTVYTDGETITRDEFVNKMFSAKDLPQTSQPAIGSFVEQYNQLTADGSQVISIHLAESLSGTVNAARQAAEMADVTSP